MREERASFELVDRIAARSDGGILPVGSGQAANAEAAGRARMNGIERARSRGWPGEVETKRKLLLLEEMFRTSVGIDVRLPSHHAMPYRATQFAGDFGPFTLDEAAAFVLIDLFDGDVITTAGVVSLPDFPLDFAGLGGRTMLAVPQSHRAVITHVEIAMTQAAAAAPLTPDFTTGVRWSLRKNGILIPGVSARFPTWLFTAKAVETSSPEAPHSLQNLLRHPINLEQGDVITGEIGIPVAGGSMNKVSIARIGGYIYPTRIDEPSVRGTKAD